MAQIGPGTLEQFTENPEALLWHATDQDIIQVHNPLADDFVAKVAVDKTVNEPFKIRQTQGAASSVETEGDAMRMYGMQGLKNPEHPSRVHVWTKVIIPSGGTVNLTGGTAKVVVNQLVTEMIQRAGMNLKIADPSERQNFEILVVKGQSTLDDLMANNNFVSEHEQISTAMSNLNESDNDEKRPLQSVGPEDRGAEVPTSDTASRGPGRPKRTPDATS